jgi:hypothetical protein
VDKGPQAGLTYDQAWKAMQASAGVVGVMDWNLRRQLLTRHSVGSYSIPLLPKWRRVI